MSRYASSAMSAHWAAIAATRTGLPSAHLLVFLSLMEGKHTEIQMESKTYMGDGLGKW